MIGLALSGGGSRAMAFHLGCLRALQDTDLLKRVRVLSTISGGSVIGAYYAYTPEKSFHEFEADIRGFLRTGFQWKIAGKLLNPLNLAGCVAGLAAAHTGDLWSFFGGAELGLRRRFSRTDLFRLVLQQLVFPELRMDSPRRADIDIVVGATELRNGSAFRFGNNVSGDWRRGKLVNGDIDVAFAVAASAAYPIFLPALDRTWKFEKGGIQLDHRVLLTDGGVYDNLGIQVLEPGRDATISLHTYPCEYIIACNAGHGQDSGDGIPRTFLRRVERSFEVVHRRVQDSIMHRLHHLKAAGHIKGFILPYLGQIDERLLWKPPVLISGDAVRYSTDFAAMPEEWIDKLSNRGEQLTRCLLSHYVPELI
jgi:NTE family protein